VGNKGGKDAIAQINDNDWVLSFACFTALTSLLLSVAKDDVVVCYSMICFPSIPLICLLKREKEGG
jgi:hypothetical protein